MVPLVASAIIWIYVGYVSWCFFISDDPVKQPYVGHERRRQRQLLGGGLILFFAGFLLTRLVSDQSSFTLPFAFLQIAGAGLAGWTILRWQVSRKHNG